MGALAAGATLVVQERFSASRFWPQVRQARATVVNFIGMMMPVLVKNEPRPDDADNTVRLFYGSPAFSPEFLAGFERRFGTDIIVGFGMTETCYGTIETIGGERRPNSSGQPRRHPDPAFENAVRIVDDAGAPSPTASPAKSPSATPPQWPATGATQRKPPPPCATAGYSPATWAGWMTTTTSTSWTAKRMSSAAAREHILPGSGGCHQASRQRAGLRHHRRAFRAGRGRSESLCNSSPRRRGGTGGCRPLVRRASGVFQSPRYIEVRAELPRTPSLRVRKDALRQEWPDLTAGCFDREAAGIAIRR